MEDITNIWTNEDELNEDQLMDYLKGKASEEDMHSVEKQMADSQFVNDAIEGLQSFSSSKKLGEYVGQLNKKLHQQLDSKRAKKEKRQIKNMSWIILAVIIILVLCVLGYVVIRSLREP